MIKKLIVGALSVTAVFAAAAVMHDNNCSRLLPDLAITASADSESTYFTSSDGRFYCELLDDVVYIEKYNAHEGTINIPAAIDGYTVRGINEKAFANTTVTKQVVFPASYEFRSIGESAFEDNWSLTEVVIPEQCSALKISYNAFRNCKALKTVYLPHSLWSQDIHCGAFNGCDNISTIEWPGYPLDYDGDGYLFNDNVLKWFGYLDGHYEIPGSIPSGLHIYCYKGSAVTKFCEQNGIAYTITNVLGDYVYSREYDDNGDPCCTIKEYNGKETALTVPSSLGSMSVTGVDFLNDKVTSVVIPNGVTYIGKLSSNLSCLSIPPSADISSQNTNYYPNLTKIILQRGRTEIGEFKFNYWNTLTTVVLPDTITTIGDFAFNQCANLTSVNIPSSVTSIGDYAFNCCESLSEITIPSSVKSIGQDAFRQCKYYLTIFCDKNSAAEKYAKENYKNYAYINGKNISSCSITLTKNYTDFNYNTDFDTYPIDEYVVVKDGSKTLVNGTDYETFYYNYYSIGVATVNIMGKANYKGIVSREYTIRPTTMAKPTLSTTDGKLRVQWTKNTKCKGFQIAIDKTAHFNSSNLHYILLSNPNQYASTIANYVKPGEKWFVKIRQFDTDYDDNRVYGVWSPYSYIIVKDNVKTVTVPNYVYSGKNITINPTVKSAKGTALVKGTDYTISPATITKAGSYTIKITGKGKYQGTISKTFRVLPAKISPSSLSSTVKGKAVFKWTKGVTGTAGYQIQYATNAAFTANAKTVLVSGINTLSRTLSLPSGTKYFVRVRPYIKVSNSNYYGAWSGYKYVTVK